MDFGKLFDTLKGPLLGVASMLIPGGPAILAAINAVLPDDNKLPETATGADMRAAVNRLNPDQRSSLMEKQLDVEIAEINSWTDIQGSLAAADATGNTTRPEIALMMAKTIVFSTLACVVVWVYSVANGSADIANSWQSLLVILGTPTALLRAYFGMRTKEKKARYELAGNQPKANPLLDVITAWRK